MMMTMQTLENCSISRSSRLLCWQLDLGFKNRWKSGGFHKNQRNQSGLVRKTDICLGKPNLVTVAKWFSIYFIGLSNNFFVLKTTTIVVFQSLTLALVIPNFENHASSHSKHWAR
jgi:hypothetical protein